jgi:acetyltransferase-like isoleucine patch superfamily enzyme
VLNTGCIVDHESMIGTAVHICPGAKLAGRVTVESGAFIGVGATVLQSLRIGCEAVVGGGAVVIRDVEPMTTVVGVPARVAHSAPSYEDFTELMIPPALR